HIRVPALRRWLLLSVFLRPEEKQLLLLRVEQFRNVNRSADSVSPDEEAVRALLLAVKVLEEALGIEHLVPLVRPGAAVELLTASLGHDADHAVGIAAVLRLVVGGQHA